MLRWVRIVCVVCLALWAMSRSALALDNFPGTILTGSSGTVSASNTTATGETGEPAGFNGGSMNSIWYSWTATATGTFIVGTCNLTAETTTNFDTTLHAYTGTAVNALTLITSNDDTTGCNSTVNANYGSWISFAVTSGTTYRFRVDGYGSVTGNYVMRWGLRGITVNLTDASATEGGDTAAYTVVLTAPPQGSAVASVAIGTSTQCTFAPTPLSFTSANFTTPQTITATAINDLVAEGTHACGAVTLTATGGGYSTTTASQPAITVYDNDNPSFTIAKSASVATISAPGTITYTITVDNNGSAVLTGTTITDALQLNAGALTLTSGPTLTSGDTNSNSILEDTETWIYTASYAVTQANINTGGSFSNTATFDTAETSPQTSGAAVTTITQSPSLVINKSYIFTTDSNSNSQADLNDVIQYSYLVTNNGNVTITNVSVADVHNGAGALGAITPATVASLAPGASTTFTANYTVIQGDIDAP
jgi:uncharacterized repeat protein (TIGR01451 family)